MLYNSTGSRNYVHSFGCFGGDIEREKDLDLICGRSVVECQRLKLRPAVQILAQIQNLQSNILIHKSFRNGGVIQTVQCLHQNQILEWMWYTSIIVFVYKVQSFILQLSITMPLTLSAEVCKTFLKTAISSYILIKVHTIYHN